MFEETPLKPAMHSSDALYGALIGSLIAFIFISAILIFCKDLRETVVNFIPLFSQRELTYIDAYLPFSVAGILAGANGALNAFLLLPFFRKIWHEHDDQILLWAASGAASGLIISLIFLITGSLAKGVFALLTLGMIIVCCVANLLSWPLSRYLSWRRWKQELYQTYTSPEANQTSYAPNRSSLSTVPSKHSLHQHSPKK